MAENVKICDLDAELKEKIKKFRFRKAKNNAAIVIKIDPANLMLILDEEHEDLSPEEMQDELPAREPRYIVYSYAYTHDDGRQSYPLCFIYLQPRGCKPEMSMMYSGSKLSLTKELGLTKVFNIDDVEDFTEEWLKSKLAFFR